MDPQDNYEEQHKADSFAVFVLLVLLMLTIITVWAFRKMKIRIIHESGMSIFYGVIVGCFVRFAPGTRVQNEIIFDPEIFFYLLLPPIIFHAGYSLNRKYFFRNFGAVLLFSTIGTFISSVLTGFLMFALISMGLDGLSHSFSLYDCLRFGALISSTNPIPVLSLFRDCNVDQDLYAIIFGESIFNNAVSIILFSTFAGMGVNSQMTVVDGILYFVCNFFGSFSMGVLFGLFTAVFLKYTSIRKFETLECALFFIMSYSSYLLAEGLGMSGIVSILFCGILQAHYSFHNLSLQSQFRTRELFELLNFLAENMVFSYLGIALFTYPHHVLNPIFILWALIAIFFSRAITIFPLSKFYNLMRRRNSLVQISVNHQLMIWFSGLRGAISFALAMQNRSSEADKIILSTTLLIVLSTVMVLGATTYKVMEMLHIHVSTVSNHSLLNRVSSQGSHISEMDHRVSPFAKAWLDFDRYYLKPFFVVSSSSAQQFGFYDSSDHPQAADSRKSEAEMSTCALLSESADEES